MPPEYRTFSCFSKLPYDIRHKIWEDVIYTPGIHFLKFERSEVQKENSERPSETTSDFQTRTSRSVEMDTGHPSPSTSRMMRPSQAYSAILKPVYPTRAADMSFYPIASKTFTQLSLTCRESAGEVNRAIHRSDNLKLDSGRLISLRLSSDVVCIDYPDLRYARGLGRWAEKLDQEQLSNIRRVAIRYQPDWDEERRLCRQCGRYHDWFRKDIPRRHLYEFLALFKNLEAFYFLDHLIFRNLTADRSESEQFKSGGRTYYEVDTEIYDNCKVNSRVFNMLAWVQENFIDYCELNAARHERPRNVKFGVIACEWDNDKLVAGKTRAKMTKKARVQGMRQKRPLIDRQLQEAMKALTLKDQHRTSDKPADKPTDLPVVFGAVGQARFDFTFNAKLHLVQKF
ncbi:hypothetical protein BX600DRAFT_147550 [Xylariales sp. PMI_506]|nr:hypothetical protein BX600DRAFT_147550 [Xylariales sp. PMI_506]